MEKAVNVLEEELHMKEFDVPDPSVIRIFERLDDISEINHRLLSAGVEINESYLVGQDLESYFMELTGDDQTSRRGQTL